MLSACGFGVLLYHPASPVVAHVPGAFARNAVMGLAMALTAVVLTYSPIGMRTGPHINPAVTLCFYRLGALRGVDAAGYIVAQFIGAVAGTLFASLALGSWLGEVGYVATLPGRWGLFAAWAGEFVIAFVLMAVVLISNRSPRTARWTGVFAAVLLFLYITFESPISGMSLNPARTFGSAVAGSLWHAIWIYFTAPPAGMLVAVELYRHLSIHRDRICGKLTHSRRVRCVFPCNCLGQPGPANTPAAVASPGA